MGRARDGAQLRDAGLERAGQGDAQGPGGRGQDQRAGRCRHRWLLRLGLLAALRLRQDSAAEDAALAGRLDAEQGNDRLRDEDCRGSRSVAVLRRVSHVLRPYRAALHDHSRRPGLHQDGAGQERVVIEPPSRPTEPQSRAAMNPFAALGLGAAIAGFFASAFSLPFDFVKTQLQKMQPLPDGSMPYKGMTDCAMKTVANHSPLRFYAGFPTYYVRIAPHCMITLVALDYIKTAQAKNGW